MLKFFKKRKLKQNVTLIDKPFKINKKNIHTFFKAIRKHENDLVREIVNENKDFVRITRPDLPKKDNDQTGLQVSFKVENFDIAEFLILQGADLNHNAKTVDEWNMPVLHQCIKATLFQCNTLKDGTDGFDRAFELLSMILSKGADPNGIDSYGNSSLMRTFLDSSQMVNHPNFDESSQTLTQIKRVFDILIENGADKDYSSDKRPRLIERIKAYGLEKYNWI